MLWALVMAGGLGNRLWPLSNPKIPKPFLKLIPGKKSLFEETITRLSPLVPKDRVWVIGNQKHLNLIRAFARGVRVNQMIGEPVPRNTAPAVAFCASQIARMDPDAYLLVLPADHWIYPTGKFQKAVREAFRYSKKSRSFSIFGVRPTFPSTSYGYLRSGKKISGSVYQLKQFVEKPAPGRARSFLRTGKYDWHAGIFLAPVRTIIESLERFHPVLMRRVRDLQIRNNRIGPSRIFQSLPNLSFDYAVLEKLKRAFLIHCDFDWCDVGTWSALERLWPKDHGHNAVTGEVFSLSARNNIAYTKDKPVFLFGINDLVVINASEALFVTKRGDAEGMRKAVRVFSERKRGKSK